MHTWLAWQEHPGMPFGTAMDIGFLDHQAGLAQRFTAWFTQVFTLS